MVDACPLPVVVFNGIATVVCLRPQSFGVLWGLKSLRCIAVPVVVVVVIVVVVVVVVVLLLLLSLLLCAKSRSAWGY
jgi:hypothetical protein